MDTNCPCRSTPRERFLDRACPIHGDAEMARRHQAARLAKSIEDMADDELEAEFRRLFGQLGEADRATVTRKLWDGITMAAYERGGEAEVKRVCVEVRREVGHG